MSFSFSPASNRQAHLKHSPSLTLELGTSRLRTTRSSKNDSPSFHTNADTGVDLDGELKSGYASGDVQYVCDVKPIQISHGFRSLSPLPDIDTESLPRRSMSLQSSPSTSFDQTHARSLTRTPSFSGQWTQQQRIEREALRRKRMRQAGGTVDVGSTTVLIILMTLCLAVILLVYFHIR
jgi:hypothetical protein